MRSRPTPFPEIAAGGFNRLDGTVQFYVRVWALLGEAHSKATVLEFGVGGGVTAHSPIAITEIWPICGPAHTG